MIYDVSMAITPTMTVYKDKAEKKPTFHALATHEANGAQDTVITMSMHTGTHMDYPWHMIAHGATSAQAAMDEALLGEVKVFDVSDVDRVDAKTVARCDIRRGDFVFFKTRNSQTEAFDFAFVDVEKSGAEALSDLGVRGVGLDALGIERDQAGHPTHKTLLSQGIIIIEGLRLKDVPEGVYELLALPLKIENMEALPLRVLLRTL